MLVAAGLVLLAGAAVPARASNDPGCTDSSRGCVIAAAQSYLDAVRTHSGAHVRLAPVIKRTRNAGEKTPETQYYAEDEMRASLDHDEDQTLDVHSAQFYVDGDQVVAFYLIEASYAEGGQQAAQTWLAERFHVTGGLIDEMEAIFFFAPGVTRTERGWPAPAAEPADSASAHDPTWCEDTSRQCLQLAASSYLDAQVRHDNYASARLADAARRTLNGTTTASSRAGVTTVEAPFGPTVTQARNVRWYLDTSTGDAIAFGAFDHQVGAHLTTLLAAQRLHVRYGLVDEIEQIVWPLPGTTPAPTGWES